MRCVTGGSYQDADDITYRVARRERLPHAGHLTGDTDACRLEAGRRLTRARALFRQLVKYPKYGTIHAGIELLGKRGTVTDLSHEIVPSNPTFKVITRG